jgi:hypothetical protein
MKYAAFFVLAGIFVCHVVTQPSCTNIRASDGSTYDLTPLINLGVISVTASSDSGTYTYNISICKNIPTPCGTSNCASPNMAGVCQTWGPDPVVQGRCCGRYDSTATVTGYPKNAGVMIHYDGGDICGSCVPSGSRETYLSINCAPSQTGSPLQNPIVLGGQPGLPPIFYVNVTSQYVCGGGGGLSGGAIFLIILLCIAFVYVVGGIIINAAVMKKSGVEVFPNYYFWVEVPGLFVDGICFIPNKIRGRSSYSSV